MKHNFSIEKHEAASTTEAAFILLDNPKMRAKLLHFRTLIQMDEYDSSNLIVQVKPLPILLELIETGANTENQSLHWLKRMAKWYFQIISESTPSPTNTAPEF